MSTSAPPPDTGTAEAGQAERSTSDLTRAAMSGWLGTALEFMDFQLYSLAAGLVFGQLFFVGDSAALAVVAAMATYAVGYVARPVGAWYFGRLGDRVGRTKVLFITIALMGGSTTLIGALPTAHDIGILAPILLVVLRLGQGFGAGAEISGAGVMLAEYAPRRRRGVIASLVALGTNCGTLGASAIWGILVAVMSEEQLLSWGWRIPFLGSAVILLVAVWIRFRLKESPVFEESSHVSDGVALSTAEVRAKAERENDTQMLEALEQKKWRALVPAFLLRFGQAGNSGILQTYMVSFITVTLAMSASVGTTVVIVSSLCAFVTVPVVGALGDRFGRRRMYQVMSVISLVLIVPTMMLIAGADVPKVFVGYIVMHNVSVMALASLENLTLPEIFGSRHRYAATGVIREIAAMIATGIGPVVAAAWVAATTGSWIPVAVLLGFFTLCPLIGTLFMPEVAGRDLRDPRNAV
ncbi:MULTISPECIES: MFS transporter [Prauserella salsuginis group]|uniref:MHS family metabolite:H+ symporter-like MFS transporter n=2 Tax=Prauserella salsuginis group TaxID=2893672 RepID=A0A839XUK7_9PSEU|nr:MULTISPECIES: MFS transporter [Prauserella salsuginis group]MBB3664243.1 MHS family metabolite:H+ symporter-like MFS transporter [Prauserella sediminis]MCR3721692.1 MFS transporter, MHS family, metabolite:H+ symporter [Prauserella flava]MCR3734384.1 MFS transporter, MHS family, metabolite:H+ symporter [Prauserella salsuginis]